jgi:hypothetical protein
VKKPRKRIFIEGRTKRKVEAAAKNKGMTVDQYIDFLFKDFPRELDQADKEERLHSIFNA